MKVCCIIGHRNFEKNNEIEFVTKKVVADLIEKEKVSEFLFGSKSKFVDFCYDIVTEYKKKYSYLKRVFVRAEYPIISDNYYKYLKSFFEESYFYSEKLINNRFGYIKRNQVMIDKSDFCIFYFNVIINFSNYNYICFIYILYVFFF